jgi:hypothetical protein
MPRKVRQASGVFQKERQKIIVIDGEVERATNFLKENSVEGRMPYILGSRATKRK